MSYVTLMSPHEYPVQCQRTATSLQSIKLGPSHLLALRFGCKGQLIRAESWTLIFDCFHAICLLDLDDQCHRHVNIKYRAVDELPN